MPELVTTSPEPRLALARRARVTLFALAVSSMGVTALACPDCPTGARARREVWNRDFAANSIALLLPFLVVGGVAAGIGAGNRPRPASRRGTPRRSGVAGSP